MVKVTLMKKCNGFCVMGVVLDTKEKDTSFFMCVLKVKGGV